MFIVYVCVWLLIASTNSPFPSSPFSSFPSTPLSLPLPPSLLSAEKKTAVGVVQGNIDEAGELVSTEISIISTSSLLAPSPPYLLTSSLPHPLTSSPPHPLTAGADGCGDPRHASVSPATTETKIGELQNRAQENRERVCKHPTLYLHDPL